MQARYCDPVVARFLSIDPVTFMQKQRPDLFNRYAYAGNDPVNFIDPNGEDKVFFQVGVNIVPGGGNTASRGIYLDFSKERRLKGIIPDIGIFDTRGFQGGLAAGMGVDLGYHRGDHSSFIGKSDSLTLDVYYGSLTLSEPQGSNSEGSSVSLGYGLGAGLSGGTVKTHALGLKDVANAFSQRKRDKQTGNQFSRMTNSNVTVKTDGNVTKVTTSRTGSRVKRTKTCTKDSDGNTSCS